MSDKEKSSMRRVQMEQMTKLQNDSVKALPEQLDDVEMIALFQELSEELADVTVSETLIRDTLERIESNETENRGDADQEKSPMSDEATGKKYRKRYWIPTLAAMAAVFALVYVGSMFGRTAVKKDAAESESYTGTMDMDSNAGAADEEFTFMEPTSAPGAEAAEKVTTDAIGGNMSAPEDGYSETTTDCECGNFQTITQAPNRSSDSGDTAENNPRKDVVQEDTTVRGEGMENGWQKATEAQADFFDAVLQLADYEDNAEQVMVMYGTNTILLCAMLTEGGAAECELQESGIVTLRVAVGTEKEHGQSFDSETAKKIQMLWEKTK